MRPPRMLTRRPTGRYRVLSMSIGLPQDLSDDEADDDAGHEGQGRLRLGPFLDVVQHVPGLVTTLVGTGVAAVAPQLGDFGRSLLLDVVDLLPGLSFDVFDLPLRLGLEVGLGRQRLHGLADLGPGLFDLAPEGFGVVRHLVGDAGDGVGGGGGSVGAHRWAFSLISATSAWTLSMATSGLGGVAFATC